MADWSACRVIVSTKDFGCDMVREGTLNGLAMISNDLGPVPAWIHMHWPSPAD